MVQHCPASRAVCCRKNTLPMVVNVQWDTHFTVVGGLHFCGSAPDALYKRSSAVPNGHRTRSRAVPVCHVMPQRLHLNAQSRTSCPSADLNPPKFMKVSPAFSKAARIQRRVALVAARRRRNTPHVSRAPQTAKCSFAGRAPAERGGPPHPGIISSTVASPRRVNAPEAAGIKTHCPALIWWTSLDMSSRASPPTQRRQ